MPNGFGKEIGNWRFYLKLFELKSWESAEFFLAACINCCLYQWRPSWSWLVESDCKKMQILWCIAQKIKCYCKTCRTTLYGDNRHFPCYSDDVYNSLTHNIFYMAYLILAKHTQLSLLNIDHNYGQCYVKPAIFIRFSLRNSLLLRNTKLEEANFASLFNNLPNSLQIHD